LEDTVCTPNEDADTNYTQAFQAAWVEHGYKPITSHAGQASWVGSDKTVQRA